MNYAALLGVVVLMSAGQVLFKLAARQISVIHFTWDTASRLFLNPYLVLGVFIYGVTTILWVLVLVDGALSRAYPFTALAMLLVPMAGMFFFGEPFSTNFAIGGALILVGLAFVVYS